jgi:ABC-2 type transport system permease protein
MNVSRLVDGLHIVWAIALKDILDALRNKVVISLILALGIMLLMPKTLALILESPHTTVPVYDLGDSRLTAALEDSAEFELRRADSIQELEGWLGNTLDPQMGLVIPADFDQVLESGGRPEMDGYVSWANRAKASGLASNLERQFAELLGQPVRVNVWGHIVYPPPDAALMPGMATIIAVTLVLVMGLQLVPVLLFEEKQTRTLDALLVSPASIAQVVVGKALAGAFYVLVAAGVVFAVNRAEVVHWEVALLFVLGIGSFCRRGGLGVGKFFLQPTRDECLDGVAPGDFRRRHARGRAGIAIARFPPGHDPLGALCGAGGRHAHLFLKGRAVGRGVDEPGPRVERLGPALRPRGLEGAPGGAVDWGISYWILGIMAARPMCGSNTARGVPCSSLVILGSQHAPCG